MHIDAQYFEWMTQNYSTAITTGLAKIDRNVYTYFATHSQLKNGKILQWIIYVRVELLHD